MGFAPYPIDVGMVAYLAGDGAYLDLASVVYGLIEVEERYRAQRVQRPMTVHRSVPQSWAWEVDSPYLAFLGDPAEIAEVADSPGFAHYQIVG